MRVKAAVAREAQGEFTVEDVELSDPGPGELLVRLAATGMCHTDLAVVERIIPLSLPRILGHESAGYVERVGDSVTGFAPGDPVVLTFSSCGHCHSCNDNRPSYCDQYGRLNFSGRRPDGSATTTDKGGTPIDSSFFGQSSFATWALSGARNTVKVRPDAPLEFLGPLGCGFSTGAGAVFNVLRPAPEMTLAVIGTGAVGLAALMAAKVMGVKRIVAADRVASRLQLARELGATDTIDTSEQVLAQALGRIGGVDCAIETSGVPALVEATVQTLKAAGTCVVLGASKQTELKLSLLPLIRGAAIRGALHGDCDPKEFIPKLVDLFMEGRFPIDKLSAFYRLDQINEAKDDSASGKTVKPILRMETAAR